MKIIFFICFIMLVGCAQPKYESKTSSPNNTNSKSPSVTSTSQTSIKYSCSLSLSVSGLCVDIMWEQVQTDTSEGSFLFEFYSPSEPTTLVDPSISPTVQLWMPSMGHGSSPVTVTRISAGTYRASNVYFIMPGGWEIRIQLKNGFNVVDQAVQEITI